jgi:hypothetical protein
MKHRRENREKFSCRKKKKKGFLETKTKRRNGIENVNMTNQLIFLAAGTAEKERAIDWHGLDKTRSISNVEFRTSVLGRRKRDARQKPEQKWTQKVKIGTP